MAKKTWKKQGPWLEQYERVSAGEPKLDEPWDGGTWNGARPDLRNWFLLKNGQVAHKAIERILNSPPPIFVVTGLPGGGRKRTALTIAQVALKHGLVDKVATNLKTDKFEQIVSLEKLEKWLLTDTEKSKLYILAGADRHLSEVGKGTLNSKFLKLARLARDTKNHIFLIGIEPPKEEEDGWRIPVEIDERLFIEWGEKRNEIPSGHSRWVSNRWDYSTLFSGWIDTPSSLRNNHVVGFKKDVAFYIEAGSSDCTVQEGFVWEIDPLQVQYSEKDPAVFYELEPSGKPKRDKGKPSGEGISSPYIEQFLKFGGAHTKAAKNMGLGADTFRRRLIQDLRRALR